MHFPVIDPDGQPIELTDHALDRYLERVAPSATRAEASAAMARCGRAIRAAATFGATAVRCNGGHRLILARAEGPPAGLDGTAAGLKVLPRVVTVLPRGQIPDFLGRAFPSDAL